MISSIFLTPPSAMRVGIHMLRITMYKASKGQKYLAIELMLNVASSDDKLAAEEEKFINKIAKTKGIHVKTLKDMNDKEKCKVLRK